jgi:hypothetical protein
MRGGRIWVAIGAAGLLAAAGAGYWVMASVRDSFISSALYQTALTRARTDSRVIDALGEPIEPGWAISGTLHNGDSGDMGFSLSGPKAAGELYLDGGGRVRPAYDVLRLTIEGGAMIDLLDGGGKLIARSDNDCEAAEACRKEGRCKHRGGDCVPGKYEHCADSEGCDTHGACGYSEKLGCVPMAGTHCNDSELCRKGGKCEFVARSCRKMRPGDCRGSRECDDEGLCTVKDDDICVAANDADCSRSAACRRDKRCTAKNGACVGHDSGSFGFPLQGTRGKVTIGSLSVQGRLPKAVVKRVLEGYRAHAAVCYSNELAKKEHLRGTVTVRFVIGRDGRVSNVGGGGDIPSGEVVSCTTRAFYSFAFPQPDGGIVTCAVKLIMTP